MNLLQECFGQGKDLNFLQMGCRGFVIFLVALALIRIAGRRSFGIRTPLDNIIIVLLGAVLSRAAVGASPFLPTLLGCTIIVLMHRLFGYGIAHNPFLGRIIEGKKFLLYQDGKFYPENMDKGLVCEEDILQGVRKTALTESLDQIQTVYMERNGEITAIRKEKAATA